MSKVTATMEVFTLDELDDSAKDHATELLCRDAWESLDGDMIGEAVAGTFAWHASGEYSGVISAKRLRDEYGITLSWSVSYSQSDGATISGTLSRDTSPNLAWPDGIHTVRVRGNTTWGGICTDVYGIDEDGGEGSHVYEARLIEAANDFVMELCQRVYRWCRDEIEAHTDPKYVLEMFQEYELQRRFRADGSYAPVQFWCETGEEVTS